MCIVFLFNNNIHAWEEQFYKLGDSDNDAHICF